MPEGRTNADGFWEWGSNLAAREERIEAAVDVWRRHYAREILNAASYIIMDAADVEEVALVLEGAGYASPVNWDGGLQSYLEYRLPMIQAMASHKIELSHEGEGREALEDLPF